jgi:U3 small nucleolar RNA-associated protein 23
MRLKKHKRHRRAVSFFKTCHGFHEPFKVLCDGTFVHHLLVNNITPADTALTNLLGAPVKIFTTSCVLAELKILGDSYAESFKAASNLITTRCEHEKRKSAVNCIAEVIADRNSEHFFVATQDSNLRADFREKPSVPLIFGLRNALLLEPPSTFQKEYAKAAEEERSHMRDFEFKMLDIKKKDNVDVVELRRPSDDTGGIETRSLNTNVSKDKVPFKKKKAKGPNPLSCKKKKSRVNHSPVKEQEGEDGKNTMRSRGKKRKRPQKTKNLLG